jgi:large subunit ribosomal protein L35
LPARQKFFRAQKNSSFYLADVRKLLFYEVLMPKSIARSKTRKSVAKRFKVTASGKVVRNQGGRRHLAECKSAKRKRRLAKAVVVDDSCVARIKKSLLVG